MKKPVNLDTSGQLQFSLQAGRQWSQLWLRQFIGGGPETYRSGTLPSPGIRFVSRLQHRFQGVFQQLTFYL